MARSILEVLNEDHRAIEALFEELDRAAGSGERAARFERVAAVVESHAACEERYFYPRLAREKALEAWVTAYLDEHEQLRDYIDDIRDLHPGDDEWAERVEELRDYFEHHAEEEETALFPKVRACLREAELLALGATYEQGRAPFADAG